MKNPSKRIGRIAMRTFSTICRLNRIERNIDSKKISLDIPLLGFLCPRGLCTLLLLLSFVVSIQASNDGNRYAKNSMLASGNWYKIKIASTGIYKLTYEDLLKIGLPNPKNVQIYGYGGNALNEDFSTPYTDDLPPVSIWMSKSYENFGPGDYILFYAKDDITWTYYPNLKEFRHSQHPYSSDSYYFVTESASGPRLIPTKVSSPTGRNVISTFQDYYLHERDIVNIAQSGREFYGESFKTNKNQIFTVNLEGITSTLATVSYEFIAKPNSQSANLLIYANDKLGKNSIIPQISSGDSYTAANTLNSYFSTNNLSATSQLRFEYKEGSSADINVHLNYFRINYTRKLTAYGAVTPFRSTALQPSTDFKIENAPTQPLVLNVSAPNAPSLIEGKADGSSYTFNASNNRIQEYVLIDLSKEIPSPTFAGKVNNQNLHASQAAEMVIIVQPYLKQYAEELAQIHKEDSNLSTLIAYPEDIYNEFSSGKPDATAYRRFMKMFYDRATNDSQKPRYLLLFGDGSYDNKLITSQWEKAEKRALLLTYQSVKSTDETTSFVTDDYFGFLDDTEGASIDKDKLDIGIGRIPVRTAQEAQAVVQKIRQYIRNEEPGIWQNTITFVADDAIASKTSSVSEKDHVVHSDSYAEYLRANKPEFILTKIYEDSFTRVKNPNGGWLYPDAKKMMLDKINSGTLVLNYVGHGSANDWSHEYILTYPDIEVMNNSKLPLWITATCDFSRFDASSTSGGEAALLNPKGGAIALFTTTRVVYATMNKILSESLFRHLFEKENGKPLRLGDIMRRTKTLDPILLTDDNKLRFLLLGDPALRLSYPDDTYKVIVETINDSDITHHKAQIQALGNTVIKGRIVDSKNNTASDFNGMLETLIFDNEQNLRTNGHVNPNQKPPFPSSEDIALDYRDFTNTVFSGKSSVENGKFELSFVTPKDILYSEGMGMMNFFAFSSDRNKSAQGVFENYTVGGTFQSAIPEHNSPIIEKMYLNNEQFVAGDKVNSSPLFYAQVSDDTGINLANGIGHNIAIHIDGKISYDLTSSFTNNGTSTKAGHLQFKIPELSEGRHTLQFKIWDVWNNSTTKEFDFIVFDDKKSNSYKFSIENPIVKDKARFIFFSESSKPIKIKYEVYSMSGVLEWAYETKGSSKLLSNYIYDWNLRGKKGSRLNAGVYTCQISVNIDGEESFESYKLVILGQ